MTAQIYRNALPTGYKLLWYRMEKVLGQGSFGITYLAWDGNLKIWVAIKEYLPIGLAVRENDYTLHPVADDGRGTYHWGLERFLQEAQTLARFSHKNIVQVYTVFEENNTAYMVMRYEAGESLAVRLSDPHFRDEATLLKLIFPLLSGLAAVHAVDLIHRDIKPANIFIRKDNSPVLLDFGSARLVVGGQTRSLTSLVTPGYAPFEQYSNEADKQGPWSDIYALGATLYKAVTARAPVEAVTRAQELFGRKTDPLKPAVEVGKDRYTPRFLQAIDRALRLRPADRPQTVAAWMALFPEPGTEGRFHKKWLAVGGVLGALGVAGVAAITTFPWWQGSNGELSLQPAASEQRISGPADRENGDSSTAQKAELRHSATAPPQTPSKHLSQPSKKMTNHPERQPAEVPEGETELAVVRGPASEFAADVDTTPIDAAKLAKAETKTDARPTPEEIERVSPWAGTTSDDELPAIDPGESHAKTSTVAPLQVQPATKTVNVSACQVQTFSVIGDAGQGRYSWWVDGNPQPETGAHYTFSRETPGAHEVRVAAGVELGSPKHRWQVVVNAPSVTKSEVKQWIAGVQGALEQRNIAKLKGLGYVHSEHEAADLLNKLQARQKLQVLLQNVRAELAGDRAELNFERIDRWYDPKSYSMIVDYSSHQATLVRRGCASLVAAR